MLFHSRLLGCFSGSIVIALGKYATVFFTLKMEVVRAFETLANF
jgi:hypothetical protein